MWPIESAPSLAGEDPSCWGLGIHSQRRKAVDSVAWPGWGVMLRRSWVQVLFGLLECPAAAAAAAELQNICRMWRGGPKKSKLKSRQHACMHACVHQLHIGYSFKLVLQNGARKTLPGGPALLPWLCQLCLMKPNKCRATRSPRHTTSPQISSSEEWQWLLCARHRAERFPFILPRSASRRGGRRAVHGPLQRQESKAQGAKALTQEHRGEAGESGCFLRSVSFSRFQACGQTSSWPACRGVWRGLV